MTMTMTKWRFKLDCRENALPQLVHKKGFKFVWIFMCWLRLDLVENDWLQVPQSNNVTSLWVWECLNLCCKKSLGSQSNKFLTFWNELESCQSYLYSFKVKTAVIRVWHPPQGDAVSTNVRGGNDVMARIYTIVPIQQASSLSQHPLWSWDIGTSFTRLRS